MIIIMIIITIIIIIIIIIMHLLLLLIASSAAQDGPRGRSTAHQPPHQVRGAGLRIVRLDGPHSAEAGQRVGAAGFATFGPQPALVAGRVQRQTRAVQRWNLAFLILRCWARHFWCPSPRTLMLRCRPLVVE